VWKGNDIVLQALEASGHLLHQEKLKHSYPHCWRHKTPIIFRSTPQWFIGMEQTSLLSPGEGWVREVAQVPCAISCFALPGSGGSEFEETCKYCRRKHKILPAWGQARLEAMIKNRPTGAYRASEIGACR